MFIDSIDTRNGSKMTPLDVDPDRLPRPGDRFDTGVAEWSVESVVWSEHPGRLRPTAIRLTPLVTASERQHQIAAAAVDQRHGPIRTLNPDASPENRRDALREVLQSAVAGETPIVIGVDSELGYTDIAIRRPVPVDLGVDPAILARNRNASAIVAGSIELAQHIRDEAKAACVNVIWESGDHWINQYDREKSR